LLSCSDEWQCIGLQSGAQWMLNINKQPMGIDAQLAVRLNKQDDLW